ncbi:MAG: endonuclease [Bacilli bacterium]|nr:endonuclease [Bacilli bacterium]
MKKRSLSIGLLLTGFAMTLGAFLIPSSKAEETHGYSASSLPTTIDLNPTNESVVRAYYANANGKQGNELLKKLKEILKSGQKYYSYDSGDTIWEMYEITDRDWDKSPASAISGYNSSTNKITGYSYNSSDPYIHALYINRDVTNQTKAWANHNQDQWGINREHVWPKAEGFNASGAGGARGDPMHLMAGNGYANNIHSNYYYGYVKTSDSYTDCGSKYSNQSGNLRGTSKTLNSGTVFEPQDSDKGDIARAIFYMVARYNYLSGSDSDSINSNNPNLKLTQSLSDWESSGYTSTTSNPGKMGIMTDLLAWHHADPVDDYEIKRNDLLYTNFTNNRNPFIDFPDWADYIWGSVNYNGSTYISNDTTPTGSASPSTDTFHAFSGGSSDPVAVTGVSLNKNTGTIEVGDSEVLTATISPWNATNRNVTWSSSNTSVATVNSSGRVEAVAEGNATITVTTSDGGFTATCAITVTASGGGGGSGESGTAVYTVASKTSVTPSGDIPSGSSATFENDSSNAGQLTYGKYLTLTLSGYDGLKITGLTLSAKSNQSKGKAEMTFTTDGNTIASISDSTFNSSSWYGDWSTSYVDIVFPSTNHDLTEQTVGDGKTLVLTVRNNGTSNTTNSVYIESISVTYESESPEKTLESISLDTSDAPTTFNVGDTFSYEGLTVTANYDDGTDDIVTPTSVSTPSLSSAGQKTVTVSYTEGGVTKTATYTITVNAVTLESIEVSDEKTDYYVGDTFVKPTVTATYSNGSTSDVTNEATFSGYNLSNAGNQTVSVSYTNGTTVNTSYSITVTALAVTSIEISGYTTTFKVGDTFSFGGTVTANYNNGSSADVTSSASYSGYDMSTAGNQTVTVSFGGQSQTYQIVVSDSGGATDSTQYELINSTSDLEIGKSYIITNGTTGEVVGLNNTTNSNNRRGSTVTVSDNLITRGSSLMSLTLGGSSGSWTFYTENYTSTDGYLTPGSGSNARLFVNATNDQYGLFTISFGNSNNAVITSTGKSTYNVMRYNANNGSPLFACYTSGQADIYLWKAVTPKVLDSISINTTNVQTTFTVGDTFNYTGLVVTANYTDSTSATVSPTSVSTPDLSSTGNKTVTVTYTENNVSKTAQYTVNVNSNPSISWTAPTINVYSGSTLSGTDVNGWSVTYNDGAGHQTVLTYSQLMIKLGGTTISIPHTWSTDDDGKSLTATYNSLTTTASSVVQVTQSVNTITAAVTENYDYTFESKQFSAAGSAELGTHSWTMSGTDDGSPFFGYDGTKGQQFGSGSHPFSDISLQSSDFSGTIDSVTVYTSGANSIDATVQVSVGGTAYGSAQTITNTNTPYTFDLGGKSGTISIDYVNSSSKAIYIKEIVVNAVGPSSNIANSLDHIAAQRVAVKFAKAFNAAMDNTENCTTGLSTSWSTCASAYNTFLTDAAALGETEEAYAKDLIKYATAQYSDDSGEACIERMMKTYEVCVQKHGQTAFMNDLVELGKAPTSVITVTLNNTTNITIIVVASVIMIAAVGGYLYIRRYKQK